jgi:acyl-coenzyme A thioesterase PaaI-like protein
VENERVNEAPNGSVHGGAITVYSESESMFVSEQRR